MRERFIKSIAVLTTILLSLLVCYALYGQINQFINPYPAEYRNGAHAYMAKQISEGVNPYLMENVTYSNAYVYGPVMPYIAGGMSITGLSALTCLKIVDFLCLLALVVLIVLSIFHFSRSWLFSLLGGAVYMGFCQVSPSPDHMGMLLEIACIIISDRMIHTEKKRYWCYGLIAALTVILFYVKVTYVLIAIPIFITLWMEDRKGAVTYALTGMLIGGGSLLILYFAYPLALINMIYIQMVEKSNIISADGILIALRSFAVFGKRHFIFIVMSMGVLIVNIVSKKRNGHAIIVVPRIFAVVITTLLIPTFYMAMNIGGGAYHNQLIGPNLIILGCICGAELMRRYDKCILWCLFLVCTICNAFISASDVSRPNSEQENANWEKMYALLDAYAEDGQELYLSSEFACYAVDKNLPIYDNGQGYYLMIGTKSYIPGLYDVGERYKWLVPALGELNIRAVELAEDLRTKIKNREFGAVVGTFNEDLFAEEVQDNYRYVDSVILRMGGEIIESKLYIPR
ncbi:MAG: hypothetical protein HDR21_08485 [Lachnospiraceae bacterium]|nr:hypothetical protein [Lachnospiraceae bacterium]